MALKRRYIGGKWCVWEVDESNLCVGKMGYSGEYEVISFEPRSYPKLHQYMQRHGLLHTSFASRERAVDAVRIALAGEPLHNPPRTRWKRVSQGVHRSRDGHWEARAQEKERGWTLTPLSASALAEVAREQAQPGFPPLSLRGETTLHATAFRADRLTRELGLELGLEEWPVRKSSLPD